MDDLTVEDLLRLIAAAAENDTVVSISTDAKLTHACAQTHIVIGPGYSVDMVPDDED